MCWRLLIFLSSLQLLSGCLSQSKNHSFQFISGGIEGGEIVARDHSLYSTIVKVFDDNSYCTGILIKPDVVLTAAHCVSEHYFHFRQSGLIDGYEIPRMLVRVEHPSGSTRDYMTTNIITHELYGPEVWETQDAPYDMALLKIEKKITDITPVDILMDEIDSEEEEFLTLGYGHFTGATNVSENNDGHLRSLKLDNFKKDDIFLSFFDQSNGPCVGDSGGPVLVKRDNKYFIGGVLSFALPAKAMSEEQRLVLTGASGDEANWDALFEAFPDFDECAGGEFYYTSTHALKDFLDYYLSKI